MAPVDKISGPTFQPQQSSSSGPHVAPSSTTPAGRPTSPVSDQLPSRVQALTTSGAVSRAPRQGLPPDALSPRKQAYLSGSSKGTQRISIDTLTKVAGGKNLKNDIEIQVNGDGVQLRQAQADWRAHQGIDAATAQDVLGAARRLDGQLEPLFQEQLDLAARAIAGDGNGVSDLRPLDADALKSALAANPALRDVVADEVAQGIGLTPEEAVRDLAAVSKRAAREGRAIAYAYTTRDPMDATGVAKGDGHSDSYMMVPSGRVLNLVPYPTEANDKLRKGLLARDIPFASADLSRLIKPYRPVNPQADAASCNSLAVSQMNQYLKNDARQLKQFSLVISGLKDGDDGDLLLPSPQALFYSQATLPLKIAEAMVREGGDQAHIDHDGRSYSVPTLAGLMRGGARCEAAFGGKIDDLDGFRRAWCAEMDVAQDRREALNYAAGGHVQNGALAQASLRHSQFPSSRLPGQEAARSSRS